jgi:hypothetical protein
MRTYTPDPNERDTLGPSEEAQGRVGGKAGATVMPSSLPTWGHKTKTGSYMTDRSQDTTFAMNGDALRGERMMMFKNLEELTRFGESIRQRPAKPIARWIAAAAMVMIARWNSRL